MARPGDGVLVGLSGGADSVGLLLVLWKLRESPVLTVLMLIGRGASIVWGGVSLLQMSWWLPFPLVFMLVTAAAIEFIEAVFCIYMLFNPLARHTIRLNRAFARGMRVQVPDEGLE